MFCTKCGAKIDEGARFCKDCGQPIKEVRTKAYSQTALIVASIFVTLLIFAGVGYKIISVLNEPSEPKMITTASDTSPQQVTKPVEKIETSQPVTKKEPEIKPLEEKEKTQIIKESQSRVYTIFTETSLGSGFLFEEKGTVITNAHVVAGYNEVVLRNVNGQQTTGTVIGISDLYDVALIQVDEYIGLQPLTIETLETDIGTEVIALGSPQGLENSASIGYLTGLNRTFESEFQYENVYQIDAQISPGSSGGPLLDAETGKVIGINSALLTADQSIGFSIPMYTMLDLIQSWSDSPMTANEVVNVFSFYDDYVYDPESSAKADSYYEDYEESEDYSSEYEYYFDENTLTEFVLYFRDNYELALDYEDFYYIEDLLLYDSTAYYEMEEYIADISGQGMVFDFLSNEITEIYFDEELATVGTYETFDFMNAAGDWTFYERAKEYTIVIDEYGAYKITDIYIYD